jgi:hypothetical protein
MQRLVKIVISIWLLSGACDICAAEGKSNLGQDPTRPRSRLDLRVKYQQITSDLELVKLTARVDHPIALDNGWKLNTRISQGFFFSDLPGPDNRNGNTDEGFGDLLTQAFFIAPSKGKTSFGFGLRTIFPVATQAQFGTGKYSLVPIGFASYFPDWLPKGSFVGMGVRNEFGFGGDDNREDIRELQLVPPTLPCRVTLLSVSSQPSAATGETNTIFPFRSTSKLAAPLVKEKWVPYVSKRR